MSAAAAVPSRSAVANFIISLYWRRIRSQSIGRDSTGRNPGYASGFAGDRAIEPLGMYALEPWQKVEPEQMAEGEGNVALPVAVDVRLLHLHLGAMP